MAEQVGRLGLEEQRFLARRGDLFIWHALLLHGGSRICNPDLTRQSMVTHYWTQTDCEKGSWDLRPTPGGWWIKRPPQTVPELDTTSGALGPVSIVEREVVDFPSMVPPPGSPADANLRERMEALPGVAR
jgi:hypothetical protein